MGVLAMPAQDCPTGEEMALLPADGAELGSQATGEAHTVRARHLRAASVVLLVALAATMGMALAVIGVSHQAGVATEDTIQQEELSSSFVGGLEEHSPIRAAVGLEWPPPARLFSESPELETCVTQVCDCSWATGGPLGFCSTIGCPCAERACWDCCCKTLFPEEYMHAMGMRYFPPMPWWAYILWALLIIFLIALIGGSCFTIAYYGLRIDEQAEKRQTYKKVNRNKDDDDDNGRYCGWCGPRERFSAWWG